MPLQVHENRIHAEHAMQPSPSLAASPFKERAATNAAASGWESDQENDGSGRECYSLPPPPHRCTALRLLCAVIHFFYFLSLRMSESVSLSATWSPFDDFC